MFKNIISKKFLGFTVFILLLVLLPLTIYILQQRQETRSGAAPILTGTTLIASIYGEKVYKKDLEKIAAEQYAPESIDNAALKNALDTLIERKILDNEKNSQNISIGQDEISKEEANNGSSANEAYYQVLRNKITLKSTKNWQAFTIGFWVPPLGQQTDLTAVEKATVTQNLADGLKALDEAEIELKTDKAPLEIAKALVSKYPSLSAILAVNGYLIKDAGQDPSGDYIDSVLYSYQSSNRGQPLFDVLYSMTAPGEVKKSIPVDQSGGNVIKLVQANPNAPFDNYDAWLATKIASLKNGALLNIVYAL